MNFKLGFVLCVISTACGNIIGS